MMTKDVKPTRNRLSTAIAAVATGIAMGMAGTASAADVELSLEYVCPLPLIGDQTIVANISATIPDVEQAGSQTPEFDIEAITDLPADVRTGLNVGRATTIEGTATADSTVSFVEREEALEVLLTIPQTEVPEGEGGFSIPAFGNAPSLELTENDVGEAVITVGDLFLDIITREADGSIAIDPIGQFTSDCTQVAGQDNVLHTFTVESGEPTVFPEISVDPDAVDFGTVQAGMTPQESITVSNVGGADLGIQDVILGGTDASDFMITNDCTTLAPSASCTIDVTYFASGEGSDSANVTIVSDDPVNDTQVVNLTGSSVEVVMPEISTELESLDFGEVPVGTMKDLDVTVSNSGGGDLVIEGIDIAGANASDFMFTDNCTTLNDQQSCTITVTYTSNVNEDRTANLEITSNDPDNAVHTVALSASKIDDDPTPPTIVEVTQTIVGETFIAASGGTLDLNGSIDAALNLGDLTLTGDLHLDPTEGTFSISDFFLFRALRATAEVEFEQAEKVVGYLDGDDIHATSVVWVKVKSVDLGIWGVRLFGLGGGEECMTSEPVVIELSNPEGEAFEPLVGGNLEGTYELPPLENCGSLTSTLNDFMSGPGNTINLTLEAQN
ncbi:MAG: choice-of-anchor D domain-containing protein [Oleiphilaceae bacterium]|nr:choice-of-anchor D domain-containing protein [Oleiphilaceae bacterium]